MWSRRRVNKQGAPTDAELYERVSSIVHEEVDELVRQNRVRLEERAFDTNEAGRDEPGLVGGALRLRPVRPEATGIDISVYDDTVGFGTGEAGAWQEIWSTADPDWEGTLRHLLRSVRDGRYSERVRRGRVFPLKVDMRFGGVSSGRGFRSKDDWVLRYSGTLASVEGRIPMPAVGEFSYEAW